MGLQQGDQACRGQGKEQSWFIVNKLDELIQKDILQVYNFVVLFKAEILQTNTLLYC